MTRSQRYMTYAKWDWIMNRRFYLTYGMIIAFGILAIFLVPFTIDILNSQADYQNQNDYILPVSPFYGIFAFAAPMLTMAFCLHAYRTKQDRILTMGLPVEKGSKLLHHTLSIYAVTIVSLVAGIVMCDIIYQSSPIFFNVNIGGKSICAKCIYELQDTFFYNISPHMEEWVKTNITYQKYFSLLVWLAMPAALLLVSNTKINKFYISAIVVISYLYTILNLYAKIVDISRSHGWHGEVHFANNMLLATLIITVVVFIALSIWGVRSFKQMQVVSRFMH